MANGINTSNTIRIREGRHLLFDSTNWDTGKTSPTIKNPVGLSLYLMSLSNTIGLSHRSSRFRQDIRSYLCEVPFSFQSSMPSILWNRSNLFEKVKKLGAEIKFKMELQNLKLSLLVALVAQDPAHYRWNFSSVYSVEIWRHDSCNLTVTSTKIQHAVAFPSFINSN